MKTAVKVIIEPSIILRFSVQRVVEEEEAVNRERQRKQMSLNATWQYAIWNNTTLLRLVHHTIGALNGSVLH